MNLNLYKSNLNFIKSKFSFKTPRRQPTFPSPRIAPSYPLASPLPIPSHRPFSFSHIVPSPPSISSPSCPSSCCNLYFAIRIFQQKNTQNRHPERLKNPKISFSPPPDYISLSSLSFS